MKCAAELMILKEAAKVDYVEKGKIEYQQMVKNAISFAENTINTDLEKSAHNREKTISARYKIYFSKDYFGNLYFQLIEIDNSERYADGTYSEIPKGKKYAWTELIKYLIDHCLTVDIERNYYFKTFGYGSQNGKYLEISVKE